MLAPVALVPGPQAPIEAKALQLVLWEETWGCEAGEA